MNKRVIMVMGVQRSGTTALFDSLAHDRNLTRFHESADNAVYYKYRLRPLPEVAPILAATRGAVLLKPISETSYRSLEELATEYRGYDLRVVWIYRDPVNVLYSMHQQDWLPLSQIDRACYSSEWVKRNLLALRFQQLHPAQIALVRYEDCSTDPLVFRQVAAWLRVNGQSVFRRDSAQGRRCIPPAVQHIIDTAVGLTPAALDAARTFRPRALNRVRRAATTFLARFPEKLKQVANGRRPGTPSQWDAAVLSAQPVLPSQVGGLQFWLDADEKCGVDLAERGPHQLKARGDVPWPFHIPFLNGRHALFFPKAKATARRQGRPGILQFGSEATWSFLAEERAFSIFVLFKPQLPTVPPNEQERAVVLRIGPTLGSPAIILEWDRQLGVSKGILLEEKSRHRQRAAVTAPNAHPHERWRVICFQKARGAGALLSISANGFAGPSCAAITSPGSANAPRVDRTLQLGGDESQRDALFFGAIAELMVFDRALSMDEQLGIIRYLKERYFL